VSEGVPHLAERLNDLFARVPRPGTTQPYSNEAAGAELSAAGVSVTGVYLSMLRSGRANNPSARLLAAIASFFGVPISYFFDEDEAASIRDQLDTLAGLRDARIQGIMTRTQGMSEAGIASLAGIVDHIRRIEGLDHDPKAVPRAEP
jgi:transcriptional regulator with XRE-family HTH domain